MSAADDIAKIIRQETELVFATFDEAAAFEVGCLMRTRALADKLPIIIDIRLWDRPLFYAALPGSTAANANWARRKGNVVKMFHKSTYCMVLEKGREDRTFSPGEGLDPADYVLAGGGFPIRVAGAGIVGVIAVSGLPERQDHGVVVDAICEYLKLDGNALALAPAPPKT